MVLADILLAVIPFRLPAHLTTYTPGESPFSTNQSVFWAIVVYLATIFGIQEYQKNRPALKLTTLFQAHNIILTVGSGTLLLLVIESSLPMLWKHGLFYSLCDEGAWTSVRMLFTTLCPFFSSLLAQRLQFYYMINYYYKYLELFDTVFLVLKKKPLRSVFPEHNS
jgi:fatty acid elongase 3